MASFRPLAGCGLFLVISKCSNRCLGFRPLAGCELFHGNVDRRYHRCGFRPLAGCELFLQLDVTAPLYWWFPSPCGV